MSTTIQVSDRIWSELNKRKKKRGDTFVDVLNNLLRIKEKPRKDTLKRKFKASHNQK